jgi:hypothetical protein
MKIFRYIRYSNFKFSFDFNPFVWSFRWHYQPPVKSDPTLRILYLRILPLSLLVVIDDGTYEAIDYGLEVSGEEVDGF